MDRPIFAVCDLEAAYAYNFMDYVNKKKKMNYDIRAFTSPETLLTFARDHKIEILLISGRAMTDKVKELDAGQLFILSEGELLPDLINYPTIYKYQSSANVVREVMEFYAKKAPAHSRTLLKQQVPILGVYSPVRRTLKTSFSLALGQLLARNKHVLYINLEEFSGFEILMGTEYKTDLSDLMYFVQQGNKNVLSKLTAMVQNIHGLDYIPPAAVQKDLSAITLENWLLLLGEIAESSLYQILILDFGDGMKDLFSLLALCSRIYMPVREDPVSAAKIGQFEKAVKSWGKADILEKTEKLRLPFHSSFGAKEYYVEQLIWGELGDYVRELIRKDGW